MEQMNALLDRVIPRVRVQARVRVELRARARARARVVQLVYGTSLRPSPTTRVYISSLFLGRLLRTLDNLR